MKPNTQRFIQKRKFIMVLPLLATPFITMIFWALGGGQGTATYGMEAKIAGLNLELPNAHFEDDNNSWDKLSLYQKAQRDSIKFNEARRNDPYFRLPPIKGSQDTVKKPGNINTSLGEKDHSVDENEKRVNEKLKELYNHLNTKEESEKKPRYEAGPESPTDKTFSNDVEKLESMMEMMQSGDAGDEEMQEIQTVLDKILDIQHPERVQQRIELQKKVESAGSLRVSAAQDQSVGFMSNGFQSDSISINRFYGLTELNSVDNAPKSFEAEIYDQQSLVSGSIIKIKLLTDIYVSGSLIPKNSFVHGVCALNGERLNIKINSIRNNGSIYPVSLTVFDLDGIEGIHVPGAIARDVAKQSSNQSLQDIQLNSLDPSLGVQAASAGIETVKSLITKKTKLIKVSVKAGYKVLLIDSNFKNQ